MKAPTRRFDVTLAGDIDLDVLLYGLPEELPLERELLASGMAIRVGGSAAITAHNLAALGNSVGFITATVNDGFGALCRDELARAGVDLSRCIAVDNDQTGVTVHLQHNALRHMFTYAGTTFALSLEKLDLGYLADTRHFHMSSYYLQKALTSRIPELFAQLKQAGVTISLDPNDDPDSKWDRGILDALSYVDVLLPNEREACLLAGEGDLDRAIAMLRECVPLLVVKHGAAGATAYSNSGSWHAPARKVDVVDAIGAGDSFNAGFLHAWLRSWPLEQALGYANLTGGWSTTANGGTAAFRDPHQLEALEAEWSKELGSAVP
ncbi:MAG TPA: sugar kinase [Terracidiphilus sp.]|nr:sugar kinase [Terracidiphilus sp.]